MENSFQNHCWRFCSWPKDFENRKSVYKNRIELGREQSEIITSKRTIELFNMFWTRIKRGGSRKKKCKRRNWVKQSFGTCWLSHKSPEAKRRWQRKCVDIPLHGLLRLLWYSKLLSTHYFVPIFHSRYVSFCLFWSHYVKRWLES